MVPDSVDPNKLVSVAEIAKEFGYSRTQLSRVASSGKIKAWHIGNTWITTRDAVMDYIKSNPLPGRPPRRKKKQAK